MDSSSQNYNCIAKIVSKPFTFRWRIEQFPVRLMEVGLDYEFDSPKFEVGDGVPMFLRVWRVKENEVVVRLYNSSREKEVKVKCSITLVNSENEKSITKNTEPRRFKISGDYYGHDYCDFTIGYTDILAADNSLTLVVEGVTFIEEQNETGVQWDFEVLRNEVSVDFGKLFDGGALSDFVVKVKDADGKEKQFKVHRAILAARSGFFAAMFSQPESKECLEGQMLVKDVDSEVMESLLRFLYTGSLKKETLDANGLEILIAADKYGVLGLKSQIERVLAEKLSVENVCGCFAVATRHSAPFLAARCKEFARGKTGEVAKTDGWRQFCAGNAELMADFLIQ